MGYIVLSLPEPFYQWLMLILEFGCLFGYIGLLAHIYSKNLVIALLDPQIIMQKLKKYLLLECVIFAIQQYLFILFLFGLVSKPNTVISIIFTIFHILKAYLSTIIYQKKLCIYVILLLEK